jgi:hypothetical protein
MTEAAHDMPGANPTTLSYNASVVKYAHRNHFAFLE